MLFLESPEKRLLLGEGNHTADPYYRFAMHMIEADQVSLLKAGDLSNTLPFFNELPVYEVPTIGERIKAVRGALPSVEQYVTAYLEGSETNNRDAVFDELLSNKNHYQNLNLSRRVFQIALANIAFRTCAGIFKNCAEQEKTKNYEALAYFGYIHDLMVGTKTNFYLFLEDPDAYDLSFVNEVAVVCQTRNSQTVNREAARHLFNGGNVSRVIGSGERQDEVILSF